MPEDPDEAATLIADLVWALGATGKFVWPIPDKGLKKRMHRIKAKALIVWGEDDALVSSVYAKEFAAADRQFAASRSSRIAVTCRRSSGSKSSGRWWRIFCADA